MRTCHPWLAEANRHREDCSAGEFGRRASLVPRRVLVVEDNPDTSESLRLLLTILGHEAEAVGGGRAALERVRSFRPEVMLCDLGLPGDMDGFEVARQIRANSGLGSPYLIALTGFGQAEDRERTRSAGFDRHLTKPASPEVLRKVLDELPPGPRQLRNQASSS